LIFQKKAKKDRKDKEDKEGKEDKEDKVDKEDKEDNEDKRQKGQKGRTKSKDNRTIWDRSQTNAKNNTMHTATVCTIGTTRTKQGQERTNFPAIRSYTR
jgi:hypothetical protein